MSYIKNEDKHCKMKNRLLSIFFSIISVMFLILSICSGIALAYGIGRKGEWWQYLLIIFLAIICGFLWDFFKRISALYRDNIDVKGKCKNIFGQIAAKFSWNNIRKLSFKLKLVYSLVIIISLAIIIVLGWFIYYKTYEEFRDLDCSPEEIEFIQKNLKPGKHFEIFGCSLGQDYKDFVKVLKDNGYRQKPSTGCLWFGGKIANHQPKIQIDTYGRKYIARIWMRFECDNRDDVEELEYSLLQILRQTYGEPIQTEYNYIWNTEMGVIELYNTISNFVYLNYDESEQYSKLIENYKNIARRERIKDNIDSSSNTL